MTGPKPKPTKLKALDGNPGRRPLNRREPIPRGLPEPPDFVTGEALREWQRVFRSAPDGFFSAADVPILATYCIAWVLFRSGLALIAKEGLNAIGSHGQPVEHPALAVIATQAGVILRVGDRLGMNPGARDRLQLTEAAEGRFSGLLGVDL